MHIIWYGSQESYDLVSIARDKLQALQARSNSSLSDIELPSLYERHDDVGVVTIQGPLIDGSAGYLRLFGVTGYDDIVEAAVEGLADKKAKALVYSVTSPGGSVKGVQGASDTLAGISALKPSTVYADEASSAAYWLASSIGHITLDELGVAGSIGAVIVHSERSRMLENDGIKTTVIRSGKHKMVANSVEPLSEEGRAHLQGMVDYASDMFVKRVAHNRRVTVDRVDSTMGQGRVFMGAQALGVGLVDRLGDLNEVLAHARRGSR